MGGIILKAMIAQEIISVQFTVAPLKQSMISLNTQLISYILNVHKTYDS